MSTTKQRRRVHGLGWFASAGAFVLALTACGGGAPGDAAPRARARIPTRTTVRAPASTTTVPASPVTGPVATVPTATAAPTSPASPAGASPAPSLADRLAGVDGASQVLAVVAGGYGDTTATFTAYQRTAGGWQQVFGPWQANIGYNGFAPPNAKHEGDGRTPTGTYGFDFAFGVQPDPGVHLSYRVVTGPSIVWDDDSTSARYNEWVDTTTADAGASPEPMDNVPAYSYGAVIGYNDSRTPGLGSAIFLHVSTGGTTAGCVSLPTDELLAVLRWLDPAQQPRIVMGTAAVIAP